MCIARVVFRLIKTAEESRLQLHFENSIDYGARDVVYEGVSIMCVRCRTARRKKKKRTRIGNKKKTHKNGACSIDLARASASINKSSAATLWETLPELLRRAPTWLRRCYRRSASAYLYTAACKWREKEARSVPKVLPSTPSTQVGEGILHNSPGMFHVTPWPHSCDDRCSSRCVLRLEHRDEC